MNAHYDAIIVGGRVAGASAALLLARAGARVALIERSRYGTDTLSTHGLMRAGVLQLSRWGVLDDLVAAGTPPIRETTFRYADGKSADVSIRPRAGVQALYAPRRYLLDRILVDAAAAAGADVRHETTLTALLRDDTDRVIGVRTRDRAGRPAELRGTITIGADGVRSAVAALVAAPVVHRGRSAGSLLYRYHAGLNVSGYEWGYGHGATSGFLPTNDGLTCVFVGARPAEMRHLLRRHGTEPAFRALLDRADPLSADRIAASRPAGPMRGWTGLVGFARRCWGPGWALVGDAGYFKDPLTTHGITDALRDAELLTDEVLEFLTGLTPAAVALARYQATRDRLSRKLLDATDTLASYDWDLDALRGILRQVSSAMSDEVDHLCALPDRRPTTAAPTLTKESRR